METWHSLTGIPNYIKEYFDITHIDWLINCRWIKTETDNTFYGWDSEIDLIKYVCEHSRR